MPQRRKLFISVFIANIIPLLGVLFFRWDLFQILLGYWAEFLIISFFGVLLLIARGFVSFGIFLLLQTAGFALISLPIVAMLLHPEIVPVIAQEAILQKQLMGTWLLLQRAAIGLFFSVAGFACSVATRFWQDVRQKEFGDFRAIRVIFSIYGRLLFLFAVIFFGAFIFSKTDDSRWVLVVFIFLKTMVDMLTALYKSKIVSTS